MDIFHPHFFVAAARQKVNNLFICVHTHETIACILVVAVVATGRYYSSYLHVADLVSDSSSVWAATNRIQALACLVSGAAVARPGTRAPFGPIGPFPAAFTH